MTDVELLPFNESPICPKCGCGDIAAYHHPYDKNRWVAAARRDGILDEIREHIRRRCERCHYAWNEAPLDAHRKILGEKE